MSSSGLKPAKWKDLPPDAKPPLRNGDFGTKGRKIDLYANFFEVDIKGIDISRKLQDLTADDPKESKSKKGKSKKGKGKKEIIPSGPKTEFVHYDVVIKECRRFDEFVDVDDLSKFPNGFPKRKRMDIFETMKKSFPAVFSKCALAYDSRKSAVCVPDNPELSKKEGTKWEVEVIGDNRRKKKYLVELKPVNRHTLNDFYEELKGATTKPADLTLTATQMMDIMFRHSSTIKYVQCGRNLFFPRNDEFGRPTNTGDGMESVVGFFGSLRAAQWKDGSLLLNVDVAHAEFYKEQTVIQFIHEFLNMKNNVRNEPLTERERLKINKELAGVKIAVSHSMISYKVTEVLKIGADKLTFSKDGINISVKQYFEEQYNKKLQYPKLNCLHVGPKTKNIYLPIEVCRIKKGQRTKKTTDQRMQAMIKSTAVPAQQRLRQTKDIVQKCDFSNDPYMKAIGFHIADKPLTVTGRVLDAPEVEMSKVVPVRIGQWDPRRQNFFEGGRLEHWGVINYDSDSGFLRDEELVKFIQDLIKMGRERNMSIEWPKKIPVLGAVPKPEIDLVDFKEKYPLTQLILVVLKIEKSLYGKIKSVGDRQINVVTQCVGSNNVKKAQGATISNILLKINSKIGGTNNIIHENSQPVVFTEPVIVMGADVNHPPARDKTLSGNDDGGLPSLAAIVASMNRFATKYAVEVRKQEARKEIITDMKEMVKNLLKAFFIATKGRKPKRIIMYRDGVSDSEFIKVLRYELRAMRDACTELGADYKPGITFIVVQKRHHTRLYAANDADKIGRSGNVPPGTTVDTKITHPSDKDFYMVSHEGIQGTSKPTHYYVLWDDNDLTMDQLQSMTYAMCHLYSRCTRSVSLPAPAYYAHLAAFRAKVHHEDLLNSAESSDGSTVSSDSLSDSDINNSAAMGTDNPLHKTHYFL